MDEPSEGLAPVILERVGKVIQDLRGGHLRILLVEQDYQLGVRRCTALHPVGRGSGLAGRFLIHESNERLMQTHLGVRTRDALGHGEGKGEAAHSTLFPQLDHTSSEECAVVSLEDVGMCGR